MVAFNEAGPTVKVEGFFFFWAISEAFGGSFNCECDTHFNSTSPHYLRNSFKLHLSDSQWISSESRFWSTRDTGLANVYMLENHP